MACVTNILYGQYIYTTAFIYDIFRAYKLWFNFWHAGAAGNQAT